MSTIYYCVPCLTHFKCKKNLSDKDKQQREEEYSNTGTVPQYDKCLKTHRCCKDKKCTQCCKLNECNEITCSACKESNIKYQCVLPKTQEEFAILEKLGLTYISGKFHEQAYFQFEKRQTITSVKKLFNHQAMNFPKYLNGDSDKNRDYSQKTWNRCKDLRHRKKCRCNFQEKEKICNVCTKDCIEKRILARWKASELSNEFGIYHYLGTSSELKKSDDTLNEKRLEDIERINHIIKNNLTINDILENKKNLLPRSWLRSLKDLEYLIKKEKEIREVNIKRFWRPCCIYLFGLGGSGKSGLVQELFGDSLYSKPQKQKSGSNWFDGYDKHEFVLFDEWYTTIGWNDIVKLLNDTDERVEIKNKAPQEAFNFGNGNVIDNTTVHRDDEIIEKTKKSGFKEGEILFKDDKVYWRKNFPQYKKNYLKDYPNVKELYKYKQELENPPIESDNLDYDSQLSEYNSDDSNYTREAKLRNKICGKRKADQLEKA
ncbi:15064_t:CDS:2, partial [Racocetra fulgida]